MEAVEAILSIYHFLRKVINSAKLRIQAKWTILFIVYINLHSQNHLLKKIIVDNAVYKTHFSNSSKVKQS